MICLIFLATSTTIDIKLIYHVSTHTHLEHRDNIDREKYTGIDISSSIIIEENLIFFIFHKLLS